MKQFKLINDKLVQVPTDWPRGDAKVWESDEFRDSLPAYSLSKEMKEWCKKNPKDTYPESDFVVKEECVNHLACNREDKCIGCRIVAYPIPNKPDEREKLIIGEDNICPITKEPCLDECCPPGSVCNLSSENISKPDEKDEQDELWVWLYKKFQEWGVYNTYSWGEPDYEATKLSAKEIAKEIKLLSQPDTGWISDERQTTGTDNSLWFSKQVLRPADYKTVGLSFDEFVEIIKRDKPKEIFHQYWSQKKPLYLLASYSNENVLYSALSWADQAPKAITYERLYKEFLTQDLTLFYYLPAPPETK